jgi:hypothetical protein
MKIRALLWGLCLWGFPAYSLRLVPMNCLVLLRQNLVKKSVENTEREAAIVAYYPDDYKLGEERDLMIYLHGFGSKPENYGNSGLGAALEKERIEKGIPEPVTLSISLGPFVLAGSLEHQAGGAFFVNPLLYWDAVLNFVDKNNLKTKNIFMMANSGGAFSGMQMLRHQPKSLRVKAAMFHVLPTIRTSAKRKGLLPLTKDIISFDHPGVALRAQFEEKLAVIVKDEHFSKLNMSSFENIKDFPRWTAVLIQDGQYDAFRYIDENVKLVKKAQLLGLSFYHHTLPEGGHFAPFDHDLALNFFKAMSNISN